jgi:ADP-heptose:LPS heptosyltransferase
MQADPSSVKRVLVCRTGCLGDSVTAIPAFRLIRRNVPDAVLTLLGDTPGHGRFGVADVAGGLSIFDRICTYRGRRGLMSALQMFLRVRQARPDLVVLLPGVRESEEGVRRKARFFRFCGVPDVRAQQHLEMTDSGQSPEPDRLISMLHALGFAGQKPGYAIMANEAARADVAVRLQSLGVDPARNEYLVFCGGGSTAAQRWPLERYAAVLKDVAECFDMPVVAIGTPAELAAYQLHIKPLFPGLKLLKSEMDSARLFEVMRGARAYFGNDTGPMHAAAAVGCPVAAIISGRNRPGAWDPDVRPRLVVRNRLDCENCFLQACIEKGHRCMLDIQPDVVVPELIHFLAALSAGQSLAR